MMTVLELKRLCEKYNLLQMRGYLAGNKSFKGDSEDYKNLFIEMGVNVL